MKPSAAPFAPRVVSIGGGKGGVGKSVVACNLAVAMAQRGQRVVLVDADLGGANQHTLFGIDRAPSGISALLDHEVERLDEAAVPTRVPNLRLVVGAGAVPNAANINHGQKLKLLRHIRGIDADVVVVDVGAGTSHNTVDFFDAADVHVVVVTPQLTSIQNAYAFLKAAVLRHFRHLAGDADQLARLDAVMTSRETERADEILARLEREDPGFAAQLRHGLGRFDARLVGNQVADTQELGIFQGVSRMVRDFLQLPLPLAGWLRTSRAVHDSINRRLPLLLGAPRDDSALAIRRIAETLVVSPVPAPPPARAPSASPAEPGRDVGSYLRQAPRVAVDWSAVLERADRAVPVRVVDVSPGGVGIQIAEPLVEGERARLRLDADGPASEPILLPVSVRNCDGGRAGLAFDDADAPAREQGRRLIERARAAKQAARSTA